ncbi:hypothetical protein DBR42_11445 [Pelomonas sp. HMWF004]|nr:hypothetical protein DBR42_11445 [Pelomonas sp. HMWF004]
MKLFASRKLTATLVALAFAPAVQAEDSMFSFSGFGTVGIGRTNTDLAHQVLGGQVRGHTTSVSGEVDSKLGVQGVLKLNDMFSATAQVLSRQNGKGNFNPDLEWGFVRAKLSPALSVRVGRMGTPYFMVSDFRNVGYANTWLRPPIDVYNQVSFSRHDGVDVTYQTSLGSSTLTLSALTGSTSGEFARLDSDFKRMVGFNATLETDNGLTFRLGHVQGRFTVNSNNLNGLVAALRRTPYTALADQMEIKDKYAAFSGIGVSYDQGNWVASAEYTKRGSESVMSTSSGWYLTLGHRFGSVLPYVTASDVKRDSTNVDNNLPSGVAALAPLKGAVDGLIASQNLSQKSLALGVRWDFYRNMALKAQFEHVKPQGPGHFAQVLPGFAGTSVKAYAVAVDFVF